MVKRSLYPSPTRLVVQYQRLGCKQERPGKAAMSQNPHPHFQESIFVKLTAVIMVATLTNHVTRLWFDEVHLKTYKVGRILRTINPEHKHINYHLPPV